MEFLAFLKEKNVLTAQEISLLRDRAAMKKSSTFHELYIKSNIGGRVIEYPELYKLLQEFTQQTGVTITELVDTRGFTLDQKIYDNLGGASKDLASIFIPLMDSTGAKFALCTRPDDKAFYDRMARGYRGVPFTYAVCSPELWAPMYSVYVNPILISQMAKALSKSDTSKKTAVLDSEARQLYVSLLDAGLKKRASDIHFISCADRCEVHMRIDGVNSLYTYIDLEAMSRICNLLRIDAKIPAGNPYAPVDGKVVYRPQDYGNQGDPIDLRISIIPAQSGMSMNIRYLSNKLYTFEELGMSKHHIKTYKRLLDLPSGLILQVGPTGSGKSTTLYAGLSYIKSSLRNILTVEDPVEITMDGITQIAVNREADVTFAGTLRAFLRHDPDVIVVGELRDSETASLVVRAANTGHLVMSSVHTNDSIGAFERIINMGVDPYSLGEVIVAVMGQRLVRRLCPHCKEAYSVSPDDPQVRAFGLVNSASTIELHRARGCLKCNNTGYHGRVAVNEILYVTPEIRDLIQHHAYRKEFEEVLRRNSFKSMYYDGILKVLHGITSLDEIQRFADDAVAFKGVAGRRRSD